MAARLTGCLAGALAAGLFGAAARAQPGPAASPFCTTAVDEQLAAWAVVAPPRPQPAASGAVIRHWPTHRQGEWVAEVRDGDTVRVARVTPAAVTTVTWSAACKPMSSERPRPAAAAPRFSDDDLARAMTASTRGVVYMWSPHMPLSVDAYRAIVTAASARGVAVHAVLDPGADRAFAAAERARGGLPPEAVRVADSVELLFRDVLVHAPAVQAWARGRLVGSAFPGAHSADEYGAWLDRMIADAR